MTAWCVAWHAVPYSGVHQNCTAFCKGVPLILYNNTNKRPLILLVFCAAWNGGGVVVSYGWDQHHGTGWFATATSPRRRVVRQDLAWDNPGVKVQGKCLSLLLLLLLLSLQLTHVRSCNNNKPYPPWVVVFWLIVRFFSISWWIHYHLSGWQALSDVRIILSFYTRIIICSIN